MADVRLPLTGNIRRVTAAASLLPFVLILQPAASAREGVGVDVVVTAARPLDAQSLADALRTYLDEYGIQVRSADAPATDDLRRRLAEARRIGEAVRALAVVRAEGGARGAVEIELVDLATDKSLVAEMPVPARSEDLYRALALKIEAILRATLSEAPERLSRGSPLQRLVGSGAAGGPAARGPPPHLGLETGYGLLAFPLGGIRVQGLSVSAVATPVRWLELTFGSAVFGSARAEARGVTAAATIVPVCAAAHLVASRGRFEGFLGVAAQATYVGVAPSSSVTPVAAAHDLVPSLGLEGGGRVALGRTAWLFARVAGLGVLVGEGYSVGSQLILDTSRLQIAVSTGVGVSVL
jgi:hypothetical protein